MRYAQRAHGLHKSRPRAICGPRAWVLTTVYCIVNYMYNPQLIKDKTKKIQTYSENKIFVLLFKNCLMIIFYCGVSFFYNLVLCHPCFIFIKSKAGNLLITCKYSKVIFVIQIK